MNRGNMALVCGLGASGRAAAALLRAESVGVLAVDECDTDEIRAAAKDLAAIGCAVQIGASSPPAGAFDMAVVSPGLPVDGPFLTELRRRGIPRLSEMELGWSRFGGLALGVTGSNGKSSVVQGLADAFAAAGRHSVPCGNYGLPVCRAVRAVPAADALIIEASSFQLETCAGFRPAIALLLNILPNHLDRHGDLETYARLKARIFARQGRGDVALVPPGWLDRLRTWSGGGGDWQTFGTGPDVDYAYSPGRIAARDGTSIAIAGSVFDNDILGAHAAALFGAARAAGLPPAAAQQALLRFEPLPHRARTVAERDGVRYVDDSKATNLSALIASVRMQDRPVWLIAGGRPKETDFEMALPALRERVCGVFLIGEAAADLAAAWAGTLPCEICGTLERAVAAARRAARPGQTILLAPACTSFDQFRSFSERGDRFQKIASEKD